MSKKPLSKAQLRELEKRLAPIFAIKSGEERRRYVARGYGDGGYGWGVWDREQGRYLDDLEILSIPESELMGETMRLN